MSSLKLPTILYLTFCQSGIIEWASTITDCAGSLYHSAHSESGIIVGPIVSRPFYRALDGVVRIPDADATTYAELIRFRGPFSNTSDYLQSFLLAELYFLSHHRSIALSGFDGEDEEAAVIHLEQGQRVLQRLLSCAPSIPVMSKFMGRKPYP